MYDLCGVVNHHGYSQAGGHYTAFCQMEDGKWNQFDNAMVKPVAADKVVTADAYILFYKRHVAAAPFNPKGQAHHCLFFTADKQEPWCTWF